MISIITAAALAAGLAPDVLLAVCWTESNHRNVISPVDGAGASYGICQVQLATARTLTKGKLTPVDLMKPAVNATYAARYLRKLIDRYNGDLNCALAAYNLGPAGLTRVKKRTATFDTYDMSCHTKYRNKIVWAMNEKPWLSVSEKLGDLRTLPRTNLSMGRR
jgi:soluble lytic murein transglycosylase-like protein